MVEQTFKKIEGAVDRYKGMEVNDLASLEDTEESFEKQLIQNMQLWKADEIRSVQIKFRPPKCNLMNVAFKHGFYFHHTNKSEGYVLMCLWLDPTVGDRIPSYADHYVGVGGVCINEKDEILLIQERR
jgi:hypothetical protein